MVEFLGKLESIKTVQGQWPKAFVIDVMPDRFGLVRRVRVRISDGSVSIRDIRKLYLLKTLESNLFVDVFLSVWLMLKIFAVNCVFCGLL